MRTTLLIMAAGLGSRYGGDKQIDGLGPNGEMLMQYSIYDAVNAGFDKLVFVIKPQHKELIEKLCENFSGIEKKFVYQDFSSIPSFYKIPEERVKPFGTVHATLCAADAVSEPFAVINADDFYGKDAFKKIHDRLVSLSSSEASMVAYRLKNTVSPSGAVTRGICEVKNGALASVTETYKITLDADGGIRDGERGELDGNSFVSMNLWGFHPSIFEGMRARFEKFLSGIAEGDIKAEYALPTLVDQMIADGALCVDVLDTSAVWFGVTYREDRQSVRDALLKMHESGEYPKALKI